MVVFQSRLTFSVGWKTSWPIAVIFKCVRVPEKPIFGGWRWSFWRGKSEKNSRPNIKSPSSKTGSRKTQKTDGSQGFLLYPIFCAVDFLNAELLLGLQRTNYVSYAMPFQLG